MDQYLLSAVQDGKRWLERFTIKGYPAAFQAYSSQYGPPYREAVRAAERRDGENGPAVLARELLDALEEGWKRARFWNRSARRFDEKRVITVYLSPMLLELGETAFANALREEWDRRWPKDTYKITTYQKLKKSFRNAIMGIEIGPRYDEEEE